MDNNPSSLMVVLDFSPVYHEALMMLKASMSTKQSRFDLDQAAREQLDFMVGSIVNSLGHKVIDPFQSREAHYKELEDLSNMVLDLFPSFNDAVRFCMRLQSEILTVLVSSFPFIDSFEIIDITSRGNAWYFLLKRQYKVIQSEY
jgi:hypothetical protein